MSKDLPVTYCGKTIQEWAESAARNSLKLYRLRRDVEGVIKDIDNGVSEEGVVCFGFAPFCVIPAPFVRFAPFCLRGICGRLNAAIIRSGTSNETN